MHPLDPRATPQDITDVAWCIQNGTDEYSGVLRVLHQYILNTATGASTFQQPKADALAAALFAFSDDLPDFEITISILFHLIDRQLSPSRPAQKSGGIPWPAVLAGIKLASALTRLH